MEMDHLDKLAASTLDGYLVRKDLVRLKLVANLKKIHKR